MSKKTSPAPEKLTKNLVILEEDLGLRVELKGVTVYTNNDGTHTVEGVVVSAEGDKCPEVGDEVSYYVGNRPIDLMVARRRQNDFYMVNITL